jgi:hypothetical protein
VSLLDILEGCLLMIDEFKPKLPTSLADFFRTEPPLSVNGNHLLRRLSRDLLREARPCPE